MVLPEIFKLEDDLRILGYRDYEHSRNTLVYKLTDPPEDWVLDFDNLVDPDDWDVQVTPAK
jgi:hypothetical protein